jgi:hypothetical protein
MTADEFLAWEAAQRERHDFIEMASVDLTITAAALFADVDEA